jgi:hypothetical protein
MESQKALLRTVMALLVACVFPMAREANAQKTGFELASSLRANTVAVEAIFSDQSKRSGFGLVIGSQGPYAYILTAHHILSGASTLDEVYVTYYVETGVLRRADRVFIEGTGPDTDIAILKAPAPSGTGWIERSAAENELPGPVWIIGLLGHFDVTPTPGRLSRVDPVRSELELQGLHGSVGQGSSGAPIVSERGIVGMYLGPHALIGSGRGPSISLIRRIASAGNIPVDLLRTSLGIQRSVRVCLTRSDILKLQGLQLELTGRNKAVFTGEDCQGVLPGGYSLRTNKKGVICTPVFLVVDQGHDELDVPVFCQVNLSGDWTSQLGEVRIIESSPGSGNYIFFAFQTDFRLMSEGRISGLGERFTFTGRRVSDGRAWSLEAVATENELRGELVFDDGTRRSISMTRR